MHNSLFLVSVINIIIFFYIVRECAVFSTGWSVDMNDDDRAKKVTPTKHGKRDGICVPWRVGWFADMVADPWRPWQSAPVDSRPLPAGILRGRSKHSQQKVHSPKGSEFQGRGAVKLTDGAVSLHRPEPFKSRKSRSWRIATDEMRGEEGILPHQAATPYPPSWITWADCGDCYPLRGAYMIGYLCKTCIWHLTVNYQWQWL